MAVCDIFIRPSRSEGFGVSFVQAMAARLPVIATPVGGIVDFISDKETGVFCAPNNPKSISQSITFLLENPSVRNKIVDNAFEMVKAKYDWERIALTMKVEVFEKL